LSCKSRSYKMTISTRTSGRFLFHGRKEDRPTCFCMYRVTTRYLGISQSMPRNFQGSYIHSSICNAQEYHLIPAIASCMWPSLRPLGYRQCPFHSGVPPLSPLPSSCHTTLWTSQLGLPWHLEPPPPASFSAPFGLNGQYKAK
jgi:hypothetical protein